MNSIRVGLFTTIYKYHFCIHGMTHVGKEDATNADNDKNTSAKRLGKINLLNGFMCFPLCIRRFHKQ
jgi:hypothetical protein